MPTLSDNYGTDGASSQGDDETVDEPIQEPTDEFATEPDGSVDDMLDSIDGPESADELDETDAAKKHAEQQAQTQAVLNHAEHRTKRRLTVGLITVIVLVVIAFFTIFKVVSYQQDLHTAAMATCTTNYRAVESSNDALHEAIVEAKKKSTYSSGDVADPNTLNDLQEALTEAMSMPTLPSCEASDSASTLMDTADLLTVYNDDLVNATHALVYATKSVESSHVELQSMQRRHEVPPTKSAYDGMDASWLGMKRRSTQTF